MKKKNNMLKKIKKSYDKFSRWVPPKLYTFFVVSCVIIFISCFSFEIDNDYWFLINLGRDILNHGIPTVEPFTFHVGFEFIAQQWLTDVIFYLIYLIF